MPYLYETHLHTSQGSACGRSTGAEHARHYHALGYTGVIITDHFFGGNTAVPRELPWEERINIFTSGYEDALQEGRKLGLQVFFGWEQTFQGDDYLVYGLDKEWMLRHPEMEHWTRKEQFEQITAAGGAVVQAHPFRQRDYIRHVRLGLPFVHGVEVANGGNDPWADAAARRYARHYGLVMTAGSDNHEVRYAQNNPHRIYGVELEKPLESIGDYVRLIRSRQPIGLHVPQERFIVKSDYPFIDSYWMDEQEDPVPTGVNWLEDTL